MQHDWIIDVLSDLRTFADNHEMGRLAEHLDDAILMAASEIKATDTDKVVMGTNEPKDNGLFRTISAG
jgi:hypothetical protein